MINKEFQELKRRFFENPTERATIINEMKENLKQRNNGEDQYVFGFTKRGVEMFISKCDKPEDLFAIDGDMCPQGK